MTPYYQHAGITIYHGDCRNVLQRIGGCELLLTDPPYGSGLSVVSKIAFVCEPLRHSALVLGTNEGRRGGTEKAIIVIARFYLAHAQSMRPRLMKAA